MADLGHHNKKRDIVRFFMRNETRNWWQQSAQRATNSAAGRWGGGLAASLQNAGKFGYGQYRLADLAPSPWRGFCLATPAPSAGSPPMPVGWRLQLAGVEEEG
jgi:hypothetical protein